jgi:hypothetical protein
MRRRFFTVSLFTLLLLSFFNQGARMASLDESSAFFNRPQQSAEVAKIQSYHDEIDAWAKQHPTAVRYFSSGDEITNENQTIYHWKEYKTKKELPEIETHASVWMKDGKVVAAILSSRTDHTSSSDGYYYRADGTLAYEESHGYSIGLEPPYMKSKSFYSSNGKTISSTLVCSIDEKKWTTCKADSGWTDSSGGDSNQSFMKTSSLPFYNLLAKGR